MRFQERLTPTQVNRLALAFTHGRRHTHQRQHTTHLRRDFARHVVGKIETVAPTHLQEVERKHKVDLLQPVWAASAHLNLQDCGGGEEVNWWWKLREAGD